ncbi:MAG: glycosyltransferase family 2 protein [Opitutaceae bacterium]|nr:glycosyltransferase family 2 protein [Opitutaceae bacterium]
MNSTTVAPLPTISLVTPSFNQAQFLSATLESVLTQNYPFLEYVVVDGGSTDRSRELITAWAARLAWWCSEPDGGMYAALNKGFAHTHGEIMGWLNSDDLLLPGALRAVGEIFARFPEVQWLSSLALSTWTPTGSCVGVSIVEGFSRTAFFDGGYLPGGARLYAWIPQESTFWRRSLWGKSGGQIDASLKFAGDFALWARFYQHADLVGTPTPLGGFRTHPAQKSRAMDAYLAEARAVLAAARAHAAHRTNATRALLLRSRIAAMPGLRGACARCFGYPARRVVADASYGWRLENYHFL